MLCRHQGRPSSYFRGLSCWGGGGCVLGICLCLNSGSLSTGCEPLQPATLQPTNETASARQQVLRSFMKSLREKRTFRCSLGLKLVGGALHFLKALPCDLSLRWLARLGEYSALQTVCCRIRISLLAQSRIRDCLRIEAQVKLGGCPVFIDGCKGFRILNAIYRRVVDHTKGYSCLPIDQQQACEVAVRA
jgi:hypothetical protein